MKKLLTLLLMGTMLCAHLSLADDDNDSPKDAKAWVQLTITSKKQMLTVAKKMKAERNVAKFNQDIDKIYNSLNLAGKTTAMGVCKPAEAPSGELYDKEFAKKASQIKKLDESIDSEMERIEGLDIQSDAMTEALFKMGKINDLLGQ